MEVGIRVVRGPDWKWGNQDDGEGHVGTVVEVGRAGSHSTPENTVVVQWDSGSRTNYRTGYQKSYDLRILDNAPVGVRHPNISCNSCGKHGIAGIRWKCTSCPNYDLCSNCYMSDKHDLNHSFTRFDTSNSIGVDVPKRSARNSVKIQSRGIFVGAKVVRGFDWDWDNQDGGEGKTGKVIDIRGWDNESRRSVANVMWASGSTNVYRLGHKGKVDLKYTVDGEGGKYYRDHLPILGQTPAAPEATGIRRNDGSSSSARVNQTSSAGSSSTAAQDSGGENRTAAFSVGDKVKVNINDEDELKGLQEGHGGWNPRMAQFMGRVGTVHRVTDHQDIRVQFEGCHNRWTFNPASLLKIPIYHVGDVVSILEDLMTVKNLQRSHGEWISPMAACLGKNGKVVKVYSDGDLRVTVDDSTWTFNPMCVTLVSRAPQPPPDNNSSTGTTSTPAVIPRDDINSLSPRLTEGSSSTSSSQPLDVDQDQQQLQDILNSALAAPLSSGESAPGPSSSSSSSAVTTSSSNNAPSAGITTESSGTPSSGDNKPSKDRNKQSRNRSTDVKKSSSSSGMMMGVVATKSGSSSGGSGDVQHQDPIERLKYLESKIAEIEETYCCGICMERVRNVVFLCGHGACVICAQTLHTCHMCREPIVRKINIY